MLPEASFTPTMFSIPPARQRGGLDVHAGAALHAVNNDGQRMAAAMAL
jgi:hypothetical protein